MCYDTLYHPNELFRSAFIVKPCDTLTGPCFFCKALNGFYVQAGFTARKNEFLDILKKLAAWLRSNAWQMADCTHFTFKGETAIFGILNKIR